MQLCVTVIVLLLAAEDRIKTSALNISCIIFFILSQLLINQEVTPKSSECNSYFGL